MTEAKRSGPAEVLAHGHREPIGDKVNLELRTRSQGWSRSVKPSQT